MVGFLPVISSNLRVGKGRSYGFCGFRGCREPVGAFGWYLDDDRVHFPVGAFGWYRDRSASFCRLCFLLPGETELGSAEEQPNKG